MDMDGFNTFEQQDKVLVLEDYTNFTKCTGVITAVSGTTLTLRDENGISRRCDTLVSDRNGRPFVIVEYKAPTVAVTQNVFDQIVRYNMVFQARYLIVSNGLAHYCCSIDYTTGSYTFLEEIPPYCDL